MDRNPPSPEGLAPTDLGEELRELRKKTTDTINRSRHAAKSLEERVAADIDRLATELAAEIETQKQSAAADLSAQQQQIVAERSSLEADREQLAADLTALELNREALELDRESHAAEREEFQTEVAEWEAVRDGIEAELAALQERLTQQSKTLASEKHELTQWAAELADERAEFESLRTELVDLKERLADSPPADGVDPALVDPSIIEEFRATEHQLRGEIEGIEQKFQLALDDVQTQRLRIAELEQELATRPEASADESAELAGLRAECDSLRARVGELESMPPEADGGAQEADDLRRRFEMAVEDVRRLKTENAQLQQRLVETPAIEGDGLDWEAQKRRLLASLEAGDAGGEGPTLGSDERATIDGTIRITDEVIAEKDREIAELREQLTSGVEPAIVVEEEAPLSDDQRFEAERERLAELQAEWEEKLRAAELELSVNRAKIAREQAELADLREELETQSRRMRNTSKPSEVNSEGGGSNWLRKFGIGD